MSALARGRYAGCTDALSGMDDERPRPRPAAAPIMYLSPTRAELVRYFAWGYLSRRELNARLKVTDTDENDGAAA